MEYKKIPPYYLTRVEYINTIRRYWADSIQYVRSLIISVLNNNPDQDAVRKRLEIVGNEYSNLFHELYGKTIHEQFTAAAAKYFDSVMELTEAYMDNNIPLIDKSRTELYSALEQFGNVYAEFIGYLDRTSILMLLYEYGNDLETQIARYPAGDFDGSFAAYDNQTNLGYRLADDISYAILKQLGMY